MRWNKVLLIALGASLVAHCVFLIASPHINMPGMRKMMDDTRKIFRIGDVVKTPEAVSLLKKQAVKPPAIKMSNKMSPKKAEALKKMTLENKVKEKAMEKKKSELKLDKVLPDMKNKFDPKELLKTDTEKTKAKVEPKKRSLAEQLADGSLITTPDSEESGSLGYDVEYDGQGTEGISDDIWGLPGEDAFQPGGGDFAAFQDRVQVGDYEDIGKYLDVQVYVYKDPASGEKYYKIEIKVKEDVRLEPMPKEIIYLIDSSKSISEEKLHYIKEGVFDSLKRLNPGDKFNLVAFRGDLIKFREEPVTVSRDVLIRARPFIRGLKATGQTDVENALLGIIDHPLTMYPSYIMFVSDGRPTTGVMDSRRIIQQITRSNDMTRPIFCFGGGKRVNKYLLDFIAYQNRGWSTFANTSYNMRKDFVEFYNQIRDPILINVRYLLNGLDVSEVYPKYLSDFYQDTPFTVYGRYSDEDVFSVRLLGEVGGRTKEFIFKKSLTEAIPASQEIAEGWAFRKIYYLISRSTMGLGDDSGIREEIESLSKKYGIITPYDLE